MSKILRQTPNGRKIYENLSVMYGDYFNNGNNYRNSNDGRRRSQFETGSINSKLDK